MVLERMLTLEIEEIPVRKGVGLQDFPGGELLPESEESHWG